jgi:hypothetical protein
MVQNLSQNLSQDMSEISTWLQKHERLIIVLFVLVFGYFALDKTLGVVVQWDNHRASVAMATVQAQQAKNDEALAQAKATLLDYQTALAASIKQNAALSAAIVTRDKAVVVQQKTDAQLPPTELGQRWENLVSCVPVGSCVQATASGFAVTNNGAIKTVQQLEQIPVLQQDVTDEKNQNLNLQTDVNKANDLISQGKIVVNGLQLQIQDQQKSCETQITAVKAQARKGKLKSFGIGFVTGYVAGQVSKFFGF